MNLPLYGELIWIMELFYTDMHANRDEAVAIGLRHMVFVCRMFAALL